MTSQSTETIASKEDSIESSESSEPSSSPSAANDQKKQISPSDYSNVSPEVLADAISIAMERRDDPEKQQKINAKNHDIFQKEQMRDNIIIATLGALILIDWVLLDGTYLTDLILIAGLGGVAYAYWRYKRGTLKGQESKDTKEK